MKTRPYTLLVHCEINGTDKSPLVGIEESHGHVWAMDEEHLRKLIKFATGCKAVFVEKKLTDAEVKPEVLRYIRTLAKMAGKVK